MKKFFHSDLSLLTFPDAEVLDMEISLEKKEVRVRVDGGWTDLDGILDKGILHISNWNSLIVREFAWETSTWNDIKDVTTGFLQDLPEVNFSEAMTVLSGFGKNSGLWTEWRFVCPTLYAEFE